MKLTDPVPSTKLSKTIARFTALFCLIVAGVILFSGIYLYSREGALMERTAIRCFMLSLALVGLAVAIDRDRLKEESTQSGTPPSKETHSGKPDRHE
ncbi:MAG: hypothetical protein HY291_22670 [Planctomycetes bacterium]|nr:hypothetical protein [Planctomycetota bacterium]